MNYHIFSLYLLLFLLVLLPKLCVEVLLRQLKDLMSSCDLKLHYLFLPCFDAADISRDTWMLRCLIPIYTPQILDKSEISGSKRAPCPPGITSAVSTVLIPVHTAQIPDKPEISGSERAPCPPGLPQVCPQCPSPAEESRGVSGEQEQCLRESCKLSPVPAAGLVAVAQSHPSLGVPALLAGCSPRVSEQPAGPMWCWHLCLLFMEMGAIQRAGIPVEMGGECRKGKKKKQQML